MFISDYDRALHERIHEKMQDENPERLMDNPRLAIFDYLKPVIGSLSGYGADIGCGSAYASIYLANNFSGITGIDAIEQSELAVSTLIPRNTSFWNAKSVNPVLGSFQSLETQKYNFVIALGALHHSPDLEETAKSIHSSLVSGGLLIAQEPSMPDFTSHAQYEHKYSLAESKLGVAGRNGDRLDRFFRECEYKAALVKAGFDLILWEDWFPKKANISKEKQLRQLVALAKQNGGVNEMTIATLDVQPKLMVAQKSRCKKIFNLAVQVNA